MGKNFKEDSKGRRLILKVNYLGDLEKTIFKLFLVNLN